jgi:hypothetical protein
MKSELLKHLSNNREIQNKDLGIVSEWHAGTTDLATPSAARSRRLQDGYPNVGSTTSRLIDDLIVPNRKVRILQKPTKADSEKKYESIDMLSVLSRKRKSVAGQNAHVDLRASKAGESQDGGQSSIVFNKRAGSVIR